MAELSEAGKKELALALILWRDFKAGQGWEPDIIKQMIGFADYLGIREELDKMMSKVPPMKIEPRNPAPQAST